MLTRTVSAGRWLILVTIVIGATQLPAAAQIEPMPPHATDGTSNAVIPRPAPETTFEGTHNVPPVYEIADERAQTHWGS